MEVWLLDSSFGKIDIIENYNSLCWTDRYDEPGEHELQSAATYDKLSAIVPGIEPDDYYLICDESEHAMCLEAVTTKTSVEDGPVLVFTGRSLESILERRCIWGQTIVSGNLQNAIKKLLDENAISPTIAERKIPGLYFTESTDPAVSEITIPQTQYTGNQLDEVIHELCNANGLGYKITLHDDGMEFMLYAGANRSNDQEENPHVTFSESFDNLASSEYVWGSKTWRNVARVAGEGEGSDRKMTTVGSASGLARRELFVDARDLSQTVDDTTLSDSEYISQLGQRGADKIADCPITEAFDAEIDNNGLYQLGTHYNMGDIVQHENKYGISRAVRVSEVTIAHDDTGLAIYPTFTNLGGDED